MIHTALARKYRPTRFAGLVAQDHIAAGLAGAVAKNRVAHAYLLTGPRGVGKTSAARILAMALNCEQRRSAEEGGQGEPCGVCDSCQRIWSGAANLDVVEIDAASNRGVDDARDLRERAMYAASGPNRYKVYIVDEAHMLTREAWNALLKILEEPPPQVVFVFATTEPQKIAKTAAPVLSRVQRFDFHPIGPQAIVDRLQFVADEESISVEPDALHLLARAANGGLRDALSLFDQVVAFGDGTVTPDRVREALGLVADETYAELLIIVAERKTEAVFPFVARLVEGGIDLVEFANGLGEALRALLLRLLGGKPEGLTTALREAVDRSADVYVQGDVLRMLKLLSDKEEAIRRSTNPRLHVETLLLQWTLLDRTVELAEILDAMGTSGVRRESAPSPAAREGKMPREGRMPREAPLARAPQTGRAERPFTVSGVRDGWPDVLEAVGERSRLAREALEQAKPVAVDGATVVLEISVDDVHREGLERNRPMIADVIGAVLGQPVALAYRTPRADDGEPAAGDSRGARRFNHETSREDRLRQIRSKDPTIDALADVLDLELLE